MPKTLTSIRDFLKRITDSERASYELMHGSGSVQRAPSGEYPFPIQGYVEKARVLLNALPYGPFLGPGGEEAAGIAFDTFALCVQRQAIAEQCQEFAARVLSILELNQERTTLPGSAFFRKGNELYSLVIEFPHDVGISQDIPGRIYYTFTKNNALFASIPQGEEERACSIFSAEERAICAKLIERARVSSRIPQLEQGIPLLTAENISIAVQCSLRYAAQRENVLQFIAQKDIPIRLPKLTRIDRIRRSSGAAAGCSIYTDIPQWLEALHGKERSYGWQLLRYAEAACILTRLTKTIVVPYIDTGRTGHNTAEAADAVQVETQIVPAKECPELLSGETELAPHLFPS